MGDRKDSFEEVYRQYYDMINRYITRAIRNNVMEAEDLTQDVFWVAYQKWDILREHPNIGGFLMVVAKNKIKKWLVRRSMVYYNEEEMLEALSDQTEESSSYDMVDLCSSVEETLSHEELDILLQYYGFGYTVSEMAKKLGVTESCFKVRVMRMREKLRRNFDLVLFLFVFFGMFFRI